MSAQLPSILVRNSFNILGLPPTSTLKVIRKKAQELLQLAKIEEIQQFGSDIGHVRELRNENEIKTALERLSGIKERLKEVFFWFDAHNVENQEAIALLVQGNYEKAINILEKASASSVDWLCQKNLALALIFEAFATSNLSSFTRSLDLWKLIAESDEFWKFYKMYYLLHDEFNTFSFLFQEFRGSLCEYISNFAASFYQQTTLPKAIGICYSAFGRLGISTDIEIIQPIILKIKKAFQDLEIIVAESMNDSSWDISWIKKKLEEITGGCSELDQFELLKYAPFIILKDDISKKLRKIYADIYNQNYNSKIAQLFIDVTYKLVSSGVLKDTIESDEKLVNKERLRKIVSTEFEQLKQLIKAEKIDQAKNLYLELDSKIGINNQEDSKEARADLLLYFCSLLMRKGYKIFKKKRFKILDSLKLDWLCNRTTQREAIEIFDYIKSLLKDYLFLFRFVVFLNIDCEPLVEIESVAKSLKVCEMSQLNAAHRSCLKSIERIACRQKHDKTYSVINMLGEVECFRLVFRKIRGDRRWKSMAPIVAVSFVVLVILFLVFGIDYKVSERPPTNHTKTVIQSPNPPIRPSNNPGQLLTEKERKVIHYLHANYPRTLNEMRKQGYDDKQIAQSYGTLEKKKENKNGR